VPRWLSDDEQRAWRALLQMTSRLEAHMNRQLQETSGLSKADYDVLVPLSEAPDGRLRIFEIARELCWEQSRLSHHLGRMQKRGLIDRENCDADRRGAFVVLTASGRGAIEKAAPAHVETIRHLVFDDLAPGQLNAVTDVAEQVLGRLDALTERADAPARDRDGHAARAAR
jgi:DNA-binding MarR family transcriptional regulator